MSVLGGASSRKLSVCRSAPLQLFLLVLLVAGGCGGGGSVTGPAPPAAGPPLTGFTLSGDPTTSAGATWTYNATVGGVTYDLQGVLLKPAGAGPFPAVVISHGFGGSATGISRGLAREMAGWGLVAIATNYTHAGGGAPIGAPGTAGQHGASPANVARARMLLDLLAALGYADMSRVAAHGHSMGAFVTAALVGAHPTLFKAASQTAGGVRTESAPDGAAPTEDQVAAIVTPYQLHHGDLDAVVPLQSGQRLANLLSARGTVHEMVVYAGTGHADMAQHPAMLARVRAWYTAHGVLR